MSTTPPPLSFDRAHYEGDPPPADACAYCHRALPTDYYRVGPHLACSNCASHAQSLIPPDAHSAYTRALLFGLVASVLACAIYSLLQINLTFNIGYFAIGVGWIIGFAMKKGAQHHGGRRYQITAAILTYVAITVSFVPATLHQMNKQKAGTTASSSSSQSSATDDANPSADNPTTPTPAKPKTGIRTFLAAILLLLGIGLVSPVLILFSSPFMGLIHLFIIYLGVQFAWKFTASPTVVVQGPFTQA